MNKSMATISLLIIIGITLFMIKGDKEDILNQADKQLSGTINIDGSSTVYPITEAVAEEFHKKYPKVKVIVNYSGTGGGFKKFYNGETQINDASRPIKSKEETEIKKNKITYIELPVAYDGLSVVVNRKNPLFEDDNAYISTDELKKIWEPGSKVQFWSEVRDGWPKEKITLYGPGVASGTFDYFTKAINGKEQASRKDFSPNEDDNALVKGVTGNTYALGYFGYAYYIENKKLLRALPIKQGNHPAVPPTAITIEDGSYQPLSRPIFIYVNAEAAKDPALKTFVEFYLDNAATLSKEVGYVALPSQVYDLAKKRFSDSTTGSIYATGQKLPLEQLLKQ